MLPTNSDTFFFFFSKIVILPFLMTIVYLSYSNLLITVLSYWFWFNLSQALRLWGATRSKLRWMCIVKTRRDWGEGAEELSSALFSLFFFKPASGAFCWLVCAHTAGLPFCSTEEFPQGVSAADSRQSLISPVSRKSTLMQQLLGVLHSVGWNFRKCAFTCGKK